MVTDLEYIEKILKEHQERIDARFDSFEKIADSIERRTDERFNSLERYLTLKIESDKCDSCSVSPRIEKAEKKIDTLMTWRIYLLAIGSIIAIFLPTIIDKILIRLF